MLNTWAESTFGALRDRDYRVLFIGTTLSMSGFMMMMIVQSIVAFDITGKNGAVGLVSLGMGLAMALVSPFGGAIADRVSKKLISLAGQALIAAAFFIIALLIMFDLITIWALALGTLVVGIAFAFIGPARQAWIGEILSGPMMTKGIALQQVTMNATRIFSPFIAGLLVQIVFVGAAGTYLIMAGLAAAVVVSFRWMPPGPPRAVRDESLLADLKVGLTYSWRRPRLRLMLLTFSGVVLAGYAYQVILPGYIENGLHRDSEKTLGIVFGVSAVGGLALSLLMVSKAGGRNASWIMFAFGAALGASLMLTAIAPSLPWALGAMVLVGAASSGFQLLNTTIIMQETEPDYFGRVISLTMLAFGFNGIAAFPYGALADAIGERETMFLMGAASIAVVALGAITLAASSRGGARSAPPLTPIRDVTPGDQPDGRRPTGGSAPSCKERTSA